MTPDDIRKLRGDLSRGELARRLGVTPLTVYRWELPETAAQSRRPRGKGLASLETYAREGRSPMASPSAVAPSQDDTWIVPLTQRLFNAELAAAEEEAFSMLASDRLTSADGRATATAVLAIIQVIRRHDVRGAFSTLQGVLASADANTLAPRSELFVRTAAAFVFAFPEGQLFHPGKVNAQLARADRLMDAATSADLRYLLRIAAVVSVFHSEGTELIARMLSQINPALSARSGRLCQVLASEAEGHRLALDGHAMASKAKLAETAELAHSMGLAHLEARARSFYALRLLDDGTPLDEVSANIAQARRALESDGVGPGLHSLFLALAEAEIQLRSANLDGAAEAVARGQADAERIKWPWTLLARALLRKHLFAHDEDTLRAIGEMLMQAESNRGATFTRAQGRLVLATADIWLGSAGSEAADVYEAALDTMAEAGAAPFIIRELATAHAEARVRTSSDEDVNRAIERAEGILEPFPSLRSSAVIRKVRAMLLLRTGRLREGIEQLESALATFRAAQDRMEAAHVAHLLALAASRASRSDAETLLQGANAELKALRLAPFPHPWLTGRFAARPTRKETHSDATTERARIVRRAMEQFALPGTSPAVVEREFLAALQALAPGRSVRKTSAEASAAKSTFRVLAGRSTTRVVAEISLAKGEEALPAVEELETLAHGATLAFDLATLRETPESHRRTGAPEEAGLPGFIAASSAMKRIAADLRALSTSRATVLITGESGTGKEVVASALHQRSSRAARPFITFNCAAVPRDLFESQLFGHRKGAFTGATSDHLGVIRAAEGGTLFLDEIAELPLDVQAKLLRFLENREVLPVGETRPVHVDVRTVAATHRDLESLVRDGRFRNDLFYRLHVVPVHLPALRERPEDIVPLANHFLTTLSPGGEAPVLAPDAADALVRHRWPGNVRELRNVIDRVLAFSPLPKVLHARDLRIGGR